MFAHGRIFLIIVGHGLPPRDCRVSTPRSHVSNPPPHERLHARVLVHAIIVQSTGPCAGVGEGVGAGVGTTVGAAVGAGPAAGGGKKRGSDCGWGTTLLKEELGGRARKC